MDEGRPDIAVNLDTELCAGAIHLSATFDRKKENVSKHSVLYKKEKIKS